MVDVMEFAAIFSFGQQVDLDLNINLDILISHDLRTVRSKIEGNAWKYMHDAAALCMKRNEDL